MGLLGDLLCQTCDPILFWPHPESALGAVRRLGGRGDLWHGELSGLAKVIVAGRPWLQTWPSALRRQSMLDDTGVAIHVVDVCV
jgi:hypothetical protein